MEKSCILIFCGCDKTGKTTLMKEVLKRTNKHICIDRFAPCQSVYGFLHSKNDTPTEAEFEFLEDFLKFSPFPVYYIHVEADTEDIEHRFATHKEIDIELEQIDLVKQWYRVYFNCHTHLPIIKINTSKNNIYECIEMIFNSIKKED